MKKKEPGQLVNLAEYRKSIFVNTRCTMPDCKFTGIIMIKVGRSIDKVHCEKCSNQTLELIYPKNVN